MKLKENWDRILSLLLIVAAVIIYSCDVPESLVKTIAFWVVVMASASIIFFKNKDNTELQLDVNVSRIMSSLIACLILFFDAKLSVCVAFGWLVVYSLKIYYRLLGGKSHIIGSVIFIIVLIIGVELSSIAGKEDALRQSAEEVVLQSVDVKSKNNIYISLEGGNIFRVSSKVAKDWDYNAGDTVKVIICGDKVISCEK